MFMTQAIASTSQKSLYSITQTARLLKKTYPTIKKWVRDGKIRPYAYVDGLPVFENSEIYRVGKEIMEYGFPLINKEEREKIREEFDYLIERVIQEKIGSKNDTAIPKILIAVNNSAGLWNMAKNIDEAIEILTKILELSEDEQTYEKYDNNFDYINEGTIYDILNSEGYKMMYGEMRKDPNEFFNQLTNLIK